MKMNADKGTSMNFEVTPELLKSLIKNFGKERAIQTLVDTFEVVVTEAANDMEKVLNEQP